MYTQKTKTKKDVNFAKLLDQYEYERPKKGDFIDAEVMTIENDRLLLDLGGKTDAVVTPKEMKNTDPDLIEELSIGDFVPVYVKMPPTMLNKTRVSLQKGVEKEVWDRAEKLLEENQAIELKVVDKNRGGLLVKFGRVKGFIPASLVPVAARFRNRKLKEKIKSSLIGEKIFLKVIQADSKRNKLIFSMRDASSELEEKRLKQLSAGDIVEGIVVSIEDYGAFVHLNGVDGLLHISEMSWDRVEDVSEIMSVGDKVEVEILDIDPEEKRVKLSRKRLLPTPGMVKVG